MARNSVAILAWAVAGLLFATTPSRAQAISMAPNVQVLLFKKIFAYNQGVNSSMKVLIVYAREFTGMASDVQKTFQKTNQTAELTSIGDFSQHASGSGVVYVIAPSVPAAVREFCAREHVFSVAPIPALAERGEVSVAIGTREDQKPEIVVNLARSKAEGQTLPMTLLSLARVIR
jgi:hypothetical protein